jgi:uncharacterized protein (TIGR02145 family)
MNRFSSYIVIVFTLILLFSCKKEEDQTTAPVSDIDGNSYNTIRTGTQIWMAENLRTTSFNDGTEIALTESSSTWDTLSFPGFCWYDNDEADHKESYGALYNGYAVNTGKLCPDGWHVPSADEWQQLIDFLGDTISGGGMLKEEGTSHWLPPNKGADNSSGFGARAAGIRYFEGTFNALLSFTSFWSASKTGDENQFYLSLYYANSGISINHISKKHGFSVRCVKD